MIFFLSPNSPSSPTPASSGLLSLSGGPAEVLVGGSASFSASSGLPSPSGGPAEVLVGRARGGTAGWAVEVGGWARVGWGRMTASR
jgi:hypothetical protein